MQKANECKPPRMQNSGTLKLPTCRNRLSDSGKDSLPSDVSSRYAIAKSSEPSFDGLFPNNGESRVMNVNDPWEIEMDVALTVGQVKFRLHMIRHEPEKDSELTTLPGRLDPIEEPFIDLFEPMDESEIAILSILEIPPLEPCPVPIPEP
jgi:hypothetical protein